MGDLLCFVAWFPGLAGDQGEAAGWWTDPGVKGNTAVGGLHHGLGVTMLAEASGCCVLPPVLLCTHPATQPQPGGSTPAKREAGTNI